MPFSLKSLFLLEPAGITPVYALMVMVAALGWYSTTAFPYFPRELGGGKKPEVKLFVSSGSQMAWGDLGLPFSEGAASVGPVVLLLESESMFVVQRVDQPNARMVPVVGIEKKLVSAVVYKPRSQ